MTPDEDTLPVQEPIETDTESPEYSYNVNIEDLSPQEYSEYLYDLRTQMYLG